MRRSLCNKKLYKTGKHLSTTAKKPDNIHFYHDKIGFNYRLPNLNAALGCAQLENIEKFILKKESWLKPTKNISKIQSSVFLMNQIIAGQITG